MPSSKDTSLAITAGLLGGITGVVIYAALAVFALALSGGVITVLWSWFITPTLTTYQLPWLQAMGVMLAIRYVWPTSKIIPTPEGKPVGLFERLARMLLSAGVALVLGWLIKSIL